MDNNIIFVYLEVLVPFGFYFMLTLLVKKISINNFRKAALCGAIVSYAVMIFLSFFIEDDISVTESILYTTILYYLIFTIVFPFLYKDYLKTYSYKRSQGNDMNSKNTKYGNSNSVVFFSYFFRALIVFGYLILFATVFVMFIFPEQKYIFQFLVVILAALGLIFFTANAFGRLFVKCTCGYYFFEFDRELKVYNIVNQVIKTRTLQCLSCNSSYVLK